MGNYELIPELSQEKAVETAKMFGVPVEEVYRQWEETRKLSAEGGVDAVMASLGNVMMETEDTLLAMVAQAEVLLGSKEDRPRLLGEYYTAATDGIDRSDMDVDNILHALIMATYLLAEAKRDIAGLQDGNRRRGGGET